MCFHFWHQLNDKNHQTNLKKIPKDFFFISSDSLQNYAAKYLEIHTNILMN